MSPINSTKFNDNDIEKKMDLKHINTAIFALILFVLCAFLGVYIYGTTTRSDYVHYSNCFKPIAPFSVQPNTEATTILSRCGSAANQRCQANANSLDQAVQFCETYANICDVFSYDPSKKKVLIHPNNTGFSPLTNTDNNVYYRNSGVTYQNSAAGNVDITANPSTINNVNSSANSAYDLIPSISTLLLGKKTTTTTN